MKHQNKWIALLLCAALLCGTAFAAQEETLEQQIAHAAQGLSALGGKAGTALNSPERFPAGTSGCDWTAMALALAGSEEYYAQYLQSLETLVQNAYAQQGCLDSRKATEYHRIALTVLALGGEPTAFGKKPDGSEIDLIRDGTYAYAGDSLGAQGLNGWIWALITLDAAGTEVPTDARYQKSDMIENILAAQEPDGGFGLIGGKSDVDITAMALQALSPYQNECREAVDAALSYLSGCMSETCGYDGYGARSAESAAQVVLALTALGIDPERDERFLRGENSLLTELNCFVLPDGTSGHSLTDTEGDYLASAQSLLALLSVQSLRTDGTWVFHFADYPGPKQKETTNGTVAWVAAGTGVCVLGAAWLTGKRKRHGTTDK